jgi:uncharacterized membrane protein YccC
LRRLVELWCSCTALRADVASGNFQRRLEEVQPVRIADKSHQHRDYGMVFLSVFATMLATVLATAFWILTAWPSGSGAAILAAAFCCLFASMDDPVPALRNFATLVLVAILFAAVYQFIIFPRLDSFGPLAAALGLTLIPAGIWMAIPARSSLGSTLCITFPMALGLQTRLHLDFGSFINQNAALFAGLAFAAVTMAVVRSMGAETGARRLLHIGWRELARLAVPGRTADGNAFIQQMFDRIALLVPRLAVISPDSAVAATDIFRDMRIGLNIIELQKQKARLASEHHSLVDELLTHLSAGYRKKSTLLHFDRNRDLSPTLRLVDKTLLAVSGSAGSAGSGVIRALVGLRNAVSGGKHLFPSFSEPGGALI